MKRGIALALVFGALAATAGQAAAAGTPADKRFAALEARVAALSAHVQAAPAARSAAAAPSAATQASRIAALERRVRTLQRQVTQARNAASAAIVLVQCLTAVTADAFTGTWNAVDQMAQATQGRTYFGAQAAVNDFRACGSFRITRQPATGTPSVAVFSALTRLIG